MEKYLSEGIKKVILDFPETANILTEYNIGCVPCSVGTCLLKDVVEIHNLPDEQKLELMYKIEKTIYPDRDVKKPVFDKTTAKSGSPKEIKYSPPIKKLADEHVLIKRLLSLIPFIIEKIDVETTQGKQLIMDAVDFIRSYADKFHHAKEEEILFKYFDENLDIVKVMLEDHITGRNHVKNVVEGVEKEDKERVIEHLSGYKELLTQHIKKEDEILYPWMDRNLSITQVGELFSKFNEVERYEKFREVISGKYEKFVETVEKKV